MENPRVFAVKRLKRGFKCEEDLWKKIMTSLEANREPGIPGEYCGHGGSEDLLENRLWEYAEGLMGEEKEAELWEQISGCSCCLTKLISIQRALSAEKPGSQSAGQEVQEGALCPEEGVKKEETQKSAEPAPDLIQGIALEQERKEEPSREEEGQEVEKKKSMRRRR